MMLIIPKINYYLEKEIVLEKEKTEVLMKSEDLTGIRIGMIKELKRLENKNKYLLILEYESIEYIFDIKIIDDNEYSKYNKNSVYLDNIMDIKIKIVDINIWYSIKKKLLNEKLSDNEFNLVLNSIIESQEIMQKECNLSNKNVINNDYVLHNVLDNILDNILHTQQKYIINNYKINIKTIKNFIQKFKNKEIVTNIYDKIIENTAIETIKNIIDNNEKDYQKAHKQTIFNLIKNVPNHRNFLIDFYKYIKHLPIKFNEIIDEIKFYYMELQLKCLLNMDIFSQIFQYIKYEDIKNISLSSKSFYNILQDNLFFKLYYSRFGIDIQKLIPFDYICMYDEHYSELSNIQ